MNSKLSGGLHVRRFARICTAFVIAALLMGVARADGLQALELFIKTATSGRADFTQVVTSPAREGLGVRSRNSSGTFAFVRPGRFRFDYKKPFEQIIVADGQTLWLYDLDLNQVTARAQAGALGSTPAALIAAAADLRALQTDFQLVNGPERDGLQWVVATPRARDAQLQAVRVGLRAGEKNGVKTAELAALEILDSFGQHSVLSFTRVQLNPSLPPETFRFKPPVGADVIRQ